MKLMTLIFKKNDVANTYHLIQNVKRAVFIIIKYSWKFWENFILTIHLWILVLRVAFE